MKMVNKIKNAIMVKYSMMDLDEPKETSLTLNRIFIGIHFYGDKC